MVQPNWFSQPKIKLKNNFKKPYVNLPKLILQRNYNNNKKAEKKLPQKLIECVKNAQASIFKHHFNYP